MQGAQLTGIALAAWVGTALLGCGTNPEPGPAPAPYSPQSVPDAWNNHFAAFGAQDLDKIMLDYDDSSVLVTWNQECVQTQGSAYKTYTGAEIRGFFQDLFAQLVTGASTEVLSFAPSSNPIVEPSTGLDATANVFLVWRNSADGIPQATDTFLWKDGYKIDRQNIVFADTAACTGAAAVKSTHQAREGNARRLKAENTQKGWDNHFAAFGGKNVSRIMLDYLPESVVRVWDWNGESYEEFAGLDKIEGMFANLFAAITAAAIGGDEGVAAPGVFVEENSVFLVWSSFSHPRATDTFLFDDDGKIVRQNIVAQTKSTALAQALV